MPQLDSPGSSYHLLAPYRRITSSGAFVPEIDGFRFVAIVAVFIYHVSENIGLNSSSEQLSAYETDWTAQVAAILNIGVPLFFVVSGLVLGMPFAEMYLSRGRPVSLKKYFLRRLTRLEPPYILALLLLLVLKLLTGRGTLGQYFPHLLASIFYLHNAVYATFSTINVVAWSLEIEVQFYILAPVLALVFLIGRPQLRRAAICLLIASATLLAQLISRDARLALSLLAFAQYFFAGFLLADIHVCCRGRYTLALAWDAVSVAGWAALLVLLTRASSAAVLWLAPALIFVLYQAGFRGALSRRFFAQPVITTIGGMCYTIYLLHAYIIYGIGLVSERLLHASPFETRLLLQLAVMGPAVLLVSAVYFRFVERPCMRPDWAPRLWARLRPPQKVRTAASA